MLAKRSHRHNYVSRYDRSLEIFAGDAARFYHCVNVKTCFRTKTEFGNFRGEGTICGQRVLNTVKTVKIVTYIHVLNF